MYDSTLPWISGSVYCSSASSSNWLDEIINSPPEIIPYKRKPHFRWNLRGWFNCRLAFEHYYNLGLKKGIQLKFRLLRSKNSWV
jgi:hypothetical protein